MSGAVLASVNLTKADLSGADLTKAFFCRTELCGAVFNGAILGGTSITFCDLSGTVGLETANHRAASAVSWETVLNSRGNIPASFLRATGVPEVAIPYFLAMGGQPLHSIDCFISHSAFDKDFAERLDSDLKARAIASWYFPRDAEWGKPLWEEIDRVIKKCRKLVLVCTEHSLQSGPVLREIDRALQREDVEHKAILFPVRLDDYVFQWRHHRQADLLAKNIGDFRRWEDKRKYDAAFERFLKALCAG
jgi:hypothetical protein